MARKPNSLVHEFLDESLPLPQINWETMAPGVNHLQAWQGLDENVEGWVPVWFASHDLYTGRPYGEFERAQLFDAELQRVPSAPRGCQGQGKSGGGKKQF